MPEYEIALFGALLKTFRTRHHLTQRQLAETIGVHRNAIGRWSGPHHSTNELCKLEKSSWTRARKPDRDQTRLSDEQNYYSGSNLWRPCIP